MWPKRRRVPTKKDYGSNWEQLSQQCKQRDNYTCRKCKRFFPKGTRWQLHAHHKISVMKLAKTRLSDLITLCRECHAGMHGHMYKRKASTEVKPKTNFKAARKRYFAKKHSW